LHGFLLGNFAFEECPLKLDKIRRHTKDESVMNEELTDLSVRYEEEGESGAIPDDIPLPALADEVVRGKRTLSRDQMRLLIELLPYHLPKLSATAHVRFDFAGELERALERAKVRSAQANLGLLLNGPVQELPASELKRPFVRPSYRRF
jgi:hypothetical protein